MSLRPIYTTENQRPELILSQTARRVIVLAAEERELRSHRHTGTEHLLLGIIRSGSEAAKVLEKRKITVDRVRQMLWQQKAATLWTAETIREPA